MPQENVFATMTPLLFATNNPHKVTEMQLAAGNAFKIISLKEAGIDRDIPEPHETLEDNAREKSRVIHTLTGLDCFSEDTGLEVDALDGEPGVRSARYAGEGRSAEDNIELLLLKLAGKDRKARFRTVISLLWKGYEFQFEGICRGEILEQREGVAGFGYDPVFRPEGSRKSFAGMSAEEKNALSHRRKAADQLVLFLQQQV